MSSETDSSHRPNTSPFLVRAVRNFLFSGIGTMGTFVIAFLFVGLTIRYLGEARAGYFMALAALAGLNALLGDFGLGPPAVRRVAILNAQGDFAIARVVVGSVMTASFFSALVIAIPLVLLFSKIFNWSRLDTIYQLDAFWATIFTMGSFVIMQASNPWRATFNALERYDLLSVLDVVFGMLSGLLGIAILILIPTMAAIAAVRFAVILTRFLVSGYFMLRLLHGIPWPTWAWGEIRPMLSFGGWVYFSEVGRLLLGRVNSLILTTFLGSTALPYYEVPQRIVRQVHGALANQSRFLFPMFSSYGDRAAVQIKRFEDRLRWFVALASAAAYMGIAFAGPDLLGRLVNPEFAMQVRLLVYLACIQGFFQAQDIVPHYSSWAMGLGKPNSVMEIIQGFLVALTAFLLIPHMGFVGASVAQLWVVATVVVHIIWVIRLISPAEQSFGWLSAFVSPLIMIGIWILVTCIFTRLISSEAVLLYAAIGIGGIIGFGSLLLTEEVIFPNAHRCRTLRQVIALPVSRVIERIFPYR